jgi:DNA-binding NarL/FixJ family response regulator
VRSILVVDDHAIVREGLKRILSDVPGGVEVCEAGDPESAMQEVRRKNWDLVLLDLNLGGKSGLDLLVRMRIERPELRVLVMSMYPEDQYAVRVLQAGAIGYMNKDSAPKELVAAVLRAESGKKVISDTTAELLLRRVVPGSTEQPHERLSGRELQILVMIATGKESQEIADELHLSVKTVGTYRARILEKIGMNNTAELILYAVKAGLVS